MAGVTHGSNDVIHKYGSKASAKNPPARPQSALARIRSSRESGARMRKDDDDNPFADTDTDTRITAPTRPSSAMARTGSGFSRIASTGSKGGAVGGGLEGEGDLKFGDSVKAGKPNLQDIAEKVKKDKQPALSLKFKVIGGPQLRTHLSRHGVKWNEEFKPEDNATLQTVFELFDSNEEGRVDARHLKKACDMLGVWGKTNEYSDYSKKNLDFREFALEMKRRGFGHRDVLHELYDPDTRKQIESRRARLRKTPTIDPDLALLREKRDRAVKNIFLEHIERQKEIFGQLDKEEEEIINGSKVLEKVFRSKVSLAERQDAATDSKKKGAPMSFKKGTQRQSQQETLTPPNTCDTCALVVAGISVMVIEARNLPPPPLLPQGGGYKRTPDTWVTCQYGDRIQRTFASKSTQAPYWNTSLHFNVEDCSSRGSGDEFEEGPPLVVQLVSKDVSEKKDLVLEDQPNIIGQVVIQAKELLGDRGGEARDSWWKLVPVESKKGAHSLKAQLYLVIKLHLRPNRPQGHSGRENQLFQRVQSVTNVEEENLMRMQRLVAWEQGRNRVHSAAQSHKLAKLEEGRSLFVPAGCELLSLCHRTMPVSLQASDVMAKLRTGFAKHFKVSSLEGGDPAAATTATGATAATRNLLKDKVQHLTSLRFVQNLSAMAKLRENGEFVRIAVGKGFCIGVRRIDEVAAVWGSRCSKLMAFAQDELGKDRAHLGDRIKIEYRHRIEKETAGLNAQEAAHRTRELEDEKEEYLNDHEAYMDKVLGRPFVLGFMRHLAVLDVALGPEHAVLLTRDGHVYTWGLGSSGKLGHGGLWDETEPRLVETLAKRRSIVIACGEQHTISITDNGSLWTWGDNRFGQLGHGNVRDMGTPCRVLKLESFDRVRMAGCGDDYTAAKGEEKSMRLQQKQDIDAKDSKEANERQAMHANANERQLMHQPAALRLEQGAPHHHDDCSMHATAATKHQMHDNASSRRKTLSAKHDVSEHEMQAHMEKLHFVEGKIKCNLGHMKSCGEDDGRARSSSSPIIVEALLGLNITKMACGSRHMLAHVADDEKGLYNVYSWGEGSQCQLGHATAHDEMTPKIIEDARGLPICNLAAGPSWSCVFVSEVDVFVYGDLGYGSSAASNSLYYRDAKVPVTAKERAMYLEH